MWPIFPQYSTTCSRGRGSDPDTVVLRNRMPDLGKLGHPGRASVQGGTGLAPRRLRDRASFPLGSLWLVHGETTLITGAPCVWSNYRACRNVIPIVDVTCYDLVWYTCSSNHIAITTNIMTGENTPSGRTGCQRKTSLSTACTYGSTSWSEKSGRREFPTT